MDVVKKNKKFFANDKLAGRVNTCKELRAEREFFSKGIGLPVFNGDDRTMTVNCFFDTAASAKRIRAQFCDTNPVLCKNFLKVHSSEAADITLVPETETGEATRSRPSAAVGTTYSLYVGAILHDELLDLEDATDLLRGIMEMKADIAGQWKGIRVDEKKATRYVVTMEHPNILQPNGGKGLADRDIADMYIDPKLNASGRAVGKPRSMLTLGVPPMQTEIEFRSNIAQVVDRMKKSLHTSARRSAAQTRVLEAKQREPWNPAETSIDQPATENRVVAALARYLTTCTAVRRKGALSTTRSLQQLLNNLEVCHKRVISVVQLLLRGADGGTGRRTFSVLCTKKVRIL
eukprot:SAG11_NODE_2970_length_2802_cov_6.706252_2_plen_347_part_00